MNKINRQIKKELEMSNCKSTREYVRKMIELVDNCDGDSESKDLLFADVMRLTCAEEMGEYIDDDIAAGALREVEKIKNSDAALLKAAGDRFLDKKLLLDWAHDSDFYEELQSRAHNCWYNATYYRSVDEFVDSTCRSIIPDRHFRSYDDDLPAGAENIVFAGDIVGYNALVQIACIWYNKHHKQPLESMPIATSLDVYYAEDAYYKQDVKNIVRSNAENNRPVWFFTRETNVGKIFTMVNNELLIRRLVIVDEELIETLGINREDIDND